MKSCFFIGHRESPDDLMPALVQAVEQHFVEYGVTDYVVGNYGNFDHLAARAVRIIKQKYPKITLRMLLPYHPEERKVAMPAGFDGSFYPVGMETVPRRVAIVRANHFAVEQVEYLIACVWHLASNAFKIVEYASSRQKKGLIKITMLEKI